MAHIDLYTYSSKEEDLIYKLVTEPLLKTLVWNVDSKGREAITVLDRTGPGKSVKVKYFRHKKDYAHEAKGQAGLQPRQLVKIKLMITVRSFSDLTKRGLGNFMQLKFPERFAKLYKHHNLDKQRKDLNVLIDSQKDRSRKKAKERALEKKKETSLEFKTQAQKNIARAILVAVFNSKLKDTGLAVKGFSIQRQAGYLKLTELLSWDSKDKDLEYLMEASERPIAEDIDLSGNSLFSALNNITSGNAYPFIEEYLLYSQEKDVRRFAIAFSKGAPTLGLLDEDEIVRAAAERLLSFPKEG